eukprot:2424006-Pyramimonas_sp.AAC.2
MRSCVFISAKRAQLLRHQANLTRLCRSSEAQPLCRSSPCLSPRPSRPAAAIPLKLRGPRAVPFRPSILW